MSYELLAVDRRLLAEEVISPSAMMTALVMATSSDDCVPDGRGPASPRRQVARRR